MRPLRVLLLPWVFCLNGCSLMLMAGGTDLSELSTRADVHEKFGEPLAADEKDGQPHEVYRLRRKIARSNDHRTGHGMLTGISFGLSEFFFFPVELYRNTSRLAVGQNVDVTYNESGNVRRIDVGRIDTIRPKQPVPDAAQSPPVTPVGHEQTRE